MDGAVKSMHLSFKLVTERLGDEDVKEKIKRIPEMCLNKPTQVFEHGTLRDGASTLLIAKTADSHVVIHIHKDGTATLDVQYYASDRDKTRLEELEIVKSLEMKIKQNLGDVCIYSRSIPAHLQRGYVTPYFSTSDELLYEYDVTLVYEKNSKWQNIKIYHSKDYGNILALDDDIMIAESDLIYTQTLLGIGHNNFRNKTVLILGGGDGGILYELLKEKPKYVLMAELDEEVVKACLKYTRRICHDAMDEYDGLNYKIQFGDCMKVLKESLDKGKKYDFVINDLSEFQLGQESSFYQYDFKTSSVLLEMSFAILAEGGKYLSRGNGVKAESFLTQYESDIQKLGMTFKRSDILVPSFRELYCLYEVWKDTPTHPNGHTET